MEFGYAICCIDKDGFEEMYHNEFGNNPLGVIMVFKNRQQAQKVFEDTKARIKDILQYGMQLKGKRKKWLFWEEELTERVPLNQDVYRGMQRLHDTLFVKQVKVV